MPGKVPAGQFATGLITNAFDTHRDLITGAILDRMIDLMATEGGIVIDDLSETDLQIVDAGGGKINVKAGNAYDKFGQRIYLATDDVASGEYVGTVDLSSGVDLSTNKNIKIEIDDGGSVEVDCAANAATPSATTIDEILAEINAAGFGTIAFRSDTVGNPDVTGNYILMKSTTTGGSSEVEFVAPASLDATNEIFGLSEAGYPHTYVGGGGYTIPDDSTTYNVIIEYLSVESNIGTFEGGYPAAADTQYTRRDDSYKVTVQLASVAVINDTAQHEQVLAEVSNTGGTLTLTDKRGDNMMRLKGLRDQNITPLAAPVLVSLTQEALPGLGISGIPTVADMIARWEAVSDASGIREYIVKIVITEKLGTTIADGIPIEYTLQGFDQTASEVEITIELPLGNKYDVFVAAKDNSLLQNISPFTLLGNIYMGSTPDSDVILMPEISVVPITNGIAVDWPDTDIAINSYEYTYTVIRHDVPSWHGPNVYNTRNSEFVINAAPGSEATFRVRIRRTNLTVSNESLSVGSAGGTAIGLNEKMLTAQDVAVLNTDDGKTARFLKRVYFPSGGTFTKLVIDVTALTLNDSDRGMIRVYRENAEAGAVGITFDVVGQADLEISATNAPGWIVIDAYDSAESGSNQAAFTADVNIVYVES